VDQYKDISPYQVRIGITVAIAIGIIRAEFDINSFYEVHRAALQH
jgi:hypothetical protein